MKRRAGLALFLGLALTTAVIRAALAVDPGEMLGDPALETRARSISEGLRCLVCQNESIDESHADLARDIRLLVRRRLQAGDSDAAIRAFLVARYGDFILLRPPFAPRTLLLWTMPALVLAAGGLGIALARRRAAARGPTEPLSRDERLELETVLASAEDAKTPTLRMFHPSAMEE